MAQHSDSVLPFLACCLLLFGRPAAAADFKPVNHTKGLCLWYGQCKLTALGWQNCLNNTPARSAEPGSDVYQLVEELCPWYAKGKDTKICCDKNMLETLKKSILPAQSFLQRCPSCFTDFMRLFCATTCDPNAATFMDVNQFFWDQTTNAISRVEVYMTYSFANILYDACKNVQSSQQGVPVIGYLCGTSPADCNGEKWLTFMGDPAEGSPTPFTLKYHFFNTTAPLPSSGITPYNTSMLRCSDKDPFSGNVRCKCADCPKGCTVIPAYNVSCMKACSTFPPAHGPRPAGDPWVSSKPADCAVIPKIGTSVTVGVLLCVATALGMVVCCCRTAGEEGGVGRARTKDDTLPHKDKKPSLCHSDCFHRLCDCYDLIMKKVFWVWRLLAATFWYIVVLCGLIVCFVFFLGLPQSNMNHPVQLTTTDRPFVRVEYAEHSFAGGLHRSTQLRITTNMSYVNYSIATASGLNIHKTIGPVFNKEVMLEVLWLQNYLTQMEVPFGSGPNKTTITLSDICFKPVNDYCTIPSVLQYFQNSEANLDYVRSSILYGTFGNWKSHVDYCLSDPASVNASDTFKPCLSQFGEPSLPDVVVGGYRASIPSYASHYDNATALLVTFVFDEQLKQGEPSPEVAAWEKAFFAFVEDHRQSPYINVSFQADMSCVCPTT